MRKILLAGMILAAASAGLAQEQTDPRKAEVVNKLNNTRITLDFTDSQLEDVINFLRDYTGINFFLDPDVRTKLTEDQLKVTIKVKDLLLKSALKLILSSKDLTATYKDGVIVVQHKEKSAAATVSLQVYDVRDLLLKIQDFPGPEMELQNSQSGLKPMFGGILEEKEEAINEEFIVEMVRANTGDRSWDDNPNVSVTLANGLLIVTQSKKVHEEIKRLLVLLRQFK